MTKRCSVMALLQMQASQPGFVLSSRPGFGTSGMG